MSDLQQRQNDSLLQIRLLELIAANPAQCQGADIHDSCKEIMKKLKPVGKTKGGGEYGFRGIDDALNAFNPLFKEHNVIITKRLVFPVRSSRTSTREIFGGDPDAAPIITKVEIRECELNILYRFTSTTDGSFIESWGYGEGQDTDGGDRSSAMAFSNALKYLLYETFVTPTDDQVDTDMKFEKKSLEVSKMIREIEGSGPSKEITNALASMTLSPAEKSAVTKAKRSFMLTVRKEKSENKGAGAANEAKNLAAKNIEKTSHGKE